MRLKLDENLPHELVDVLAGMGHDSSSVFDQRLTGASDATVWSVVQREGRFFVTRDLDFADARKFVPGTHHGILVLRLGNLTVGTLLTRLRELLAQADEADWSGCLVVAAEATVRVRRPRNNR